MTKVFVGRVVNTHGIKGELRIKSDLTINQKKEIFKVGTNLIVDDKKYLINSYRIHKDYDLVTFAGYNNINEVLFLKGKKVYKGKEEFNLDSKDILDSELLEFKVFTIDHKCGSIISIEKTGANYKIFRLLIDGVLVLVPYHKDFIESIDVLKKEVVIKLP